MASIRKSPGKVMREIALGTMRPWIVGAAGFLTAAALMAVYWQAEAADRTQVARGKYLVTQGVCTDCHPGYVFGKPDPARLPGGSGPARGQVSGRG